MSVNTNVKGSRVKKIANAISQLRNRMTLFVRASACERLHGFDEAYFAYLEDADLCLAKLRRKV